MDYLEKAKRVLDIEIFELQRLRERLDANFSRAVTLIKDCVEARGKVVVLGRPAAAEPESAPEQPKRRARREAKPEAPPPA